ncbi:hypothetical protein AV656_12940 [Bhargavaea cecembensis]|uniref:Lantibiotic dehydratase N-terminal domain-containing protein n=1 Tax=Bhargavaea cecembensis TaxID=394098 RepID=A0A163EXY9_9BACL|nr:hypothetical protein [Bhargavaea cecembensis]KZE37467.1 hypothetical protein AV656_12940 [Bhargavaea cecembensis]
MNLKLNRIKTSVHLSEVAIAQVHDLPASVIDSLVLSASMSLVQRLSRHQAAVSEAWNSVEGVLERAGLQTVEELEQNIPGLSDSDWEIVQLWVKRKTELDNALERFKLIYRMGREQADAKLFGMTKIPSLQRKVVLKHPELLNADIGMREETSEALLVHLLHSTVESGESGTTEVRFRLGEQSTTDEFAEDYPQVRIRQPLVDRWTQAMALDHSLNEGFTFRVNDGLICQEGKAGLLVADGIEVGGTPTVHEYVYPVEGKAAGHLKKGTARRKKDWIRSLKRSGGKAKFEELLSKEILVPILPEKQAEMCPLQGLASLVARIDSPEARRLRRCFLLLEQLLGQMESGTPASLPALRNRAACTVERIHGILPIRLSGRLAAGDWFTEHQSCNEKPIGLPESIREDLEVYANDPGVTVIRSSIADTMTAWFADKYGRGGECGDVLGFLSYCESRLGAAEEAGIAEKDAQLAASGAGMQKPAGPSEMVPHGTLSFRVAARSEQAMKRGDYQILAECRQGGVASEDEKWIRELLPDAEPLWFSYGSGWTGASRRYNGRQLLWPTDRQYAGRGGHFLTLPDLRIVHDQESDTLVIVGPEGTPVAPVYTGKIPVHQLPVGVRLFLKLSNPWTYVKKGGSGRKSQGYSPRQTEGRVVTLPAEWRIPSVDVPLQEIGESESDYYLRLHDWRVRNGIPQEAMFAVVDSKFPTAACSDGKERYVHFGSPRLIGRLKGSLAEKDLLILTEVFPERGAHAIGRSGQPCVTEFRVAVKWA